jgi:glutamine synthetase
MCPVSKAAEKGVALHYVNTSSMEDPAQALIELSEGMERAYEALEKLKQADREAVARMGDATRLADAYCKHVIPAMETLRREVDRLETKTSSEFWPIPTYAYLMFRQKGKI